MRQRVMLFGEEIVFLHPYPRTAFVFTCVEQLIRLMNHLEIQQNVLNDNSIHKKY